MGNVKGRTVEDRQPPPMPCLCGVLRQASRAVTRSYDEELRGTGLRVTQYTLLRILEGSGEIRQRDLGELASLDETTLTRSLVPLEKCDWVTVRAGDDRREKLVALTEAGRAKVAGAEPAWSRAQERMRASLPEGAWDELFTALPDLTRAATSTARSRRGSS
jgi:DNA-binding MarR family transcriptional regulator